MSTPTPAKTAHAAGTGQPVIRVEGLAKIYAARQVLETVTFEVRPAEIFGIVGSNGAGKTTTVEIIQGLRPRDVGMVQVLGVDPARDRSRLRGLIGSQLQSSALPERLTVAEALRLFARLAGDVVDWRALRDEWGLARVSGSAFGTLSGGEQQRLFVALALVNRPRIVFLDELTQGLDPAARRETWRLVHRIREQGASVVLVTHDMDEAGHLCDRIAVLDHGRIRACGTPAELVASLARPVYTHFSATATDLTGLESPPGVLEVKHDGRRARIRGNEASVLQIATALTRRGLAPTDFTIDRPSLDDVFVTITNGELQ